MEQKDYESLILMVNTLGAKMGERATLLIKGARSKRDAQGRLTDEATLQAIRQLMLSFNEKIEHSRSASADEH